MLKNRQRKIEFQTNEAQDERNRSEFKTPEGTRREGPPFPINLSTKSQEFILQNLPLEKRREEQRGGEEGAWEMRGRWSGLLGARREGERRGVRGYLRCPRRDPKYP